MREIRPGEWKLESLLTQVEVELYDLARDLEKMAMPKEGGSTTIHLSTYTPILATLIEQIREGAGTTSVALREIRAAGASDQIVTFGAGEVLR